MGKGSEFLQDYGGVLAGLLSGAAGGYLNLDPQIVALLGGGGSGALLSMLAGGNWQDQLKNYVSGMGTSAASQGLWNRFGGPTYSATPQDRSIPGDYVDYDTGKSGYTNPGGTPMGSPAAPSFWSTVLSSAAAKGGNGGAGGSGGKTVAPAGGNIWDTILKTGLGAATAYATKRGVDAAGELRREGMTPISADEIRKYQSAFPGISLPAYSEVPRRSAEGTGAWTRIGRDLYGQ